MRLAFALLLTTLTSRGEFLRIEVSFEDSGCASCIESLAGRLQRVRGVEKVEINASKGIATMLLAPGNQVRLTPLLSRISQDGTKILRTLVDGRGTIASSGQGYVFKPSGLAQTYRLELPAGSKTAVDDRAVYRVTGVIAEPAPGTETVLTATAVTSAAVGE